MNFSAPLSDLKDCLDWFAKLGYDVNQQNMDLLSIILSAGLLCSVKENDDFLKPVK